MSTDCPRTQHINVVYKTFRAQHADCLVQANHLRHGRGHAGSRPKTEKDSKELTTA